MTYEQMKMHHFGAPCACTQPLAMPAMPGYIVHTPPRDEMATQEKGSPLTPDKFNGLSNKDIEMFHKFRYVEADHRADALAASHKRATALRDYFTEQGSAKFTSNYKSK